MQYDLICPFLTDNPMFAYGVEFGLLFARMKEETEIKDYFCRANQERVLLLANRLGWCVDKIERYDKCWFWLEMSHP